MDVAIANSNTWVTTAGATSNFTFTATGNYVLVAVAKRGTNSTPTVNYGGVPMVGVGGQGNSLQNFIYIFGLLNPPAGAQTVSVTNGGTTSSHGTFAVSLSNVNTSTQVNVVGSNVGGSINTTTTKNKCGILHFANAGDVSVNANNLTASTNLTNIDNTSGAYIAARASTFPQVTAGLLNTVVTATGFNIASVTVAVESAGANSTNFFLLT